MVDSKRMWMHRGFIIVLIGVALSAYYTLQKMFIEHLRLRREMFDNFDEELENETATHIVMARLNAQIKEMTYLAKIKTDIETTNAAQIVFNDHLYFGLSNDNFVIVVRVHRAVNHLHQMISSLSKVNGCKTLFVIFVHDCNDVHINQLESDIVLFKYMQFYYPYSCDIFMNIYPGQDPNFCDVGYNCVENGGKRNASLVEQKHLWWWTVHQVFSLEVMKNYSKSIVFVDEHSYFAEDIVYFKRLMEKAVSFHCPDCMMMNFGGRNPSASHYNLHEAYVTIEPFGSSDFTNGIAFNRSMWNKMKALKDFYCYFNDYSWVESLKNLIKFATENFLVYSSVGSRVFDTSKCEVTSQNITCDFDGVKKNITTFIQSVKRGFYPHNAYVIPKEPTEVEVLERGGWEDIRDKDLCIFLASKAKGTFDPKL